MKRIILFTLTVLLSATQLMADETETLKVDKVVITATRYEEKVSSVPAHISVIDEEDISNSNAQNIPDLIRREAGVYVSDTTGNKRSVIVDIHGFGETAALNTLVLVDGRRVNNADLSGTDWTQIPLERVARIEIMRGGQGSVLYGDNAAGGVINIITKKGEDMNAGASLAYGSYDTLKGSLYLSGRSEKAALSLNGSYLNSDGYRKNSDTEAKDAGVDLDIFINDYINLNLSGGYHEDNTGLPGGLLISALTGGISRDDTVEPDNFSDTKDYYIKATPEFYFMENSVAKVEFSYRKREFLSFYAYSNFFGEGDFTGDAEIDTITVSPQLILKGSAKGIHNTLSLGFDYESVKEHIINDSNDGGVPQPTETFDLDKTSYGYYIHDEIEVTDKFSVSGGYRHDKAKFKFKPSTPDNSELKEDAFSVGANYLHNDNVSTYINFSRSFRYPVLDEFYNYYTNTLVTSLVPQKSDDIEIGVRIKVNEGTSVNANLFRVSTKDEIFFNPDTGANSNLDGRSLRKGIEIALKSRLSEMLALGVGYTYIDTEIKDGMFKGKAIPNVPMNKVTGEVQIFPLKGLMLGLNAVFTDSRPFISDFSNSFEKQEAFFVLNSKVKYKWKNITAFLDINNILDEEYSEYGVLGYNLDTFAYERAFYPSPEINALLGVSFEI